MDACISWLMEGDPAIRWQTLRDLLDAPQEEWRAEQARTLETGWGARLLAEQQPNGGWGGGAYSPKWISTTYTLLTLTGIGIPRTCAAGRRGAEQALAALLGPVRDTAFKSNLARLDRCIVGMLLHYCVYFGMEDERIEAIADNLLNERMPDQAWNCRRGRRPEPYHSSVHTTINVLEGVREYVEWDAAPRRAEMLAAEQAAREFLLVHRLFRSHRSGEIIRPEFTLLPYPPRWHYDILRALEHFARSGAARDPRLQDAVDILKSRRRTDGTWSIQHRYGGKVFFWMEPGGKPSRWNTLRALRVLRWWEGTAPA